MMKSDELKILKEKFDENQYVVIDDLLDEKRLEEALDLLSAAIEDDWWLSVRPTKDPVRLDMERYLQYDMVKVTGGELNKQLMEKYIARTQRIKAEEDERRFIYEETRKEGAPPRLPIYTHVLFRTVEEAPLAPLADLFAETFEDLAYITSSDAVDFYRHFMSSYSKGCYLNPHTDEFYMEEGVRPKAAFIYYLTSGWEASFGGLLHIMDAYKFYGPGAERIKEVVVPKFNRLALMKVPQLHFVSEVAQSCPATRQAFSGWLV